MAGGRADLMADNWNSPSSIWCYDCGIEIDEEELLKTIKQTGAFKGICTKCVEVRFREGETITTW